MLCNQQKNIEDKSVLMRSLKAIWENVIPTHVYYDTYTIWNSTHSSIFVPVSEKNMLKIRILSRKLWVFQIFNRPSNISEWQPIKFIAITRRVFTVNQRYLKIIPEVQRIQQPQLGRFHHENPRRKQRLFSCAIPHRSTI